MFKEQKSEGGDVLTNQNIYCYFKIDNQFWYIIPINNYKNQQSFKESQMKNNRLKQPQPFAKIKKIKRQNGQIEQIRVNQQQQTTRKEQDYNTKPKGQAKLQKEDAPLNQDFEDQFEDVYEQEDVWISQPSQDSQSQEQVQGTMVSQISAPEKKISDSVQHTFSNRNTKIKIKEKQKRKAGKEQQMQQEASLNSGKPSVFLGNNKSLQKGEVLQFDNRAYDMLHRLNIEWPSLSIDFVIPKSPFDGSPVQHKQMKKYPFQVFTVQGSSNNSKDNSIYLTKWSKLHRTKYDDDQQNQDNQDDESINNDQEAQVLVQQIATNYSVNRIRTLNNAPVVAFWNENAEIHIMDLVERMNKLENGVSSKKRESCKQIILQSQAQGFGLSWNPKSIGQLVSGNNLGHVQVFTNNQSFTAWQRTSLYHYHKGSVQDIVFSPTQKDVFATCSSDGTLQIVDMKSCDGKKSSLKINAHKQDVNVCDWNRMASHLIVTGSDDSTVKIWDLRMIKQSSKYAEQLLCFKFHNEPITSIKFQPNDESVLAVASEDNRLSIWDMSAQNEQFDPEVPNQLMFLHQGQQEIKQICFHPIYFEMLISTASDGINIFKPAFDMPQENEENDEDFNRQPIRQEDLDKYLGRMTLE